MILLLSGCSPVVPSLVNEFRYYKDRIQCNNGNFIIANCYFQGLKMVGDESNRGACISFISSVSSYFQAKMCYFSECQSVGTGGAVFVSVVQSNVLLEKSCGFKCITGGTSSVNAAVRGQFANLNGDDNTCFEYKVLSISQCGYIISESTYFYDSFYMRYGAHHLSSINSSNNIDQRYTSLSSLDAKTFHISYYNCFMNRALQYTSFLLERYGPDSKIEYSNFNNNTTPVSHGVLLFLWTSNNAYISNCVFQKNYGKLFSSDAANLPYVSQNNWIFHTGSTVLNEITMLSETQTHRISDYNQAQCFADGMYRPTGSTRTWHFIGVFSSFLIE